MNYFILLLALLIAIPTVNEPASPTKAATTKKKRPSKKQRKKTARAKKRTTKKRKGARKSTRGKRKGKKYRPSKRAVPAAAPLAPIINPAPIVTPLPAAPQPTVISQPVVPVIQPSVMPQPEPIIVPQPSVVPQPAPVEPQKIAAQAALRLQQQKKAAADAAQGASEIIDEPVESQNGAECGYHALYNAWAKYNRLANKPTPPLDRVLKEWKAAIAARRKKNADKAQLTAKKAGVKLLEEPRQGDQWINDGEVEELARMSLDVPRNEYSIITDVIQLQKEPLLILENLIQAAERLKNSPDGFHAFVLGDMAHHLVGSPGGNAGHWIAVVVHKQNGKYSYYVLDSINSKPRRVVDALKWLLEQADLGQLQKMQKGIEEIGKNIPLARKAYESGDFTGALKIIQELFENAIDVGLLEQRPFLEQKEPLVELLDNIAMIGDAAQQKQAEALREMIK